MAAVREIAKERLSEYGQIPTSFEVKTILKPDFLNNGLAGIMFNEVEVAKPYWKNYDQAEEDRPDNWARKFNIDNWGILVAVEDDKFVGGAVLAYRNPEVRMLEGRSDLSVLWDIRVDPEYRSKGIGRILFAAAAEWSKQRGCKMMKIETQNINTAACKFYHKLGSRLGIINCHAYRDYPEEIMLVWYYDL